MILEKCRVETKEDYNSFLDYMGIDLGSLNTTNSAEEDIKYSIRELLFSTLNYKPEERLTMSEVVTNIKQFRSTGSIVFKHQRADSTKVLILDKEDRMVELSCGDKIIKEQLIEYALELFINEKLYEYSCICSVCNMIRKLNRLSLDCGCRYAQFGKGIPQTEIKICSENKSLTITDICLVNDYKLFENTRLTLSEYLSKVENANLIETFNKTIIKRDKDKIIWTFKNTELITYLDLKVEE